MNEEQPKLYEQPTHTLRGESTPCQEHPHIFFEFGETER